MNKKSRVENSIKNVSYGLIVTVLNTLISFISRTVFVRILGEEALGLNGLFTEVIAMMSLAELGVGMAIVYYLYKPFHDGDTKRISQLMSLYKDSYNIIALAIFTLGILLTPIIDNLVTDINYPVSYIQVVFLLFVIKTASSYLFSYKTALLNADQKQYIVALVNVIVKFIFTILSIVLLIITGNYIVYLVVQIVHALVTNIALSWYVDKQYPFVDYRQKMDKDDRKTIFADIKNIFVKRVSGVITSSTDNVLISKLVSTIQVGLYSNYLLIFSLVRTLKQQLTNGIAASIGNLSVTETPEKCIAVLRRLTFLYFAFAVLMSTGLVAVSDLFITIWLGSEFVMDSFVIYVAIFNLFLEITSEPLWQYLEVSGLFKKDKNIGIIGSSVNLVVSIVLGIRLGIVGIFIGTICTQVIQIIMKTNLLFKGKFHYPTRKYYGMWIKMLGVFLATAVLQILANEYLLISNVFVDFLVKGMIAVALSITVSFIAFAKNEEWNYAVDLCMAFVRKFTKKA